MVILRHLITLLLLLCSITQLTSQVDRSFVVKKIDEIITLDGVLDEDVWLNHKGADGFWQYFPIDTVRSGTSTDIKMAYDDKNLYIAVKCESIGDQFIVNDLKRDYRAGGNDNITLMFDSFYDGTNCVFFGTNHLGVKREGLIVEGGQEIRNFSGAWDNAWKSKSRQDGNVWYAEFEIPFRILRFNQGAEKWRFNSYRFDTQANENSTWMRIPRNQWIFNLAYMGDMIWEEGLNVPSKKSVTLIPFATTSLAKDYEEASPTDTDAAVGFDAKLAVSSGLNLDMTVNPDFSQVEVDRQITNLDRFEIFFPERRQFFLENADLFGSFGSPQINPFFSRRIGIAKNLDDENISNTIYAGARLSGKVNDKLRVGLLNMQTADDDANLLPSYNYTVAVAQRKFLSRSNIGLIWVNKQAFGEYDESFNDRFNRVIGLDFNYANEGNTQVGKLFYHRSLSTENQKGNYAHGLNARFDKRSYALIYNHELVGEGYDAQVGFVRRTNYFRMRPAAEKRFYPEGDWLSISRLTARGDIFYRPDFGKTDHTYSLVWSANSKRNERISLELNHDYIYLFDDFDPTGTSSEELAEDTDYNYWSITGAYNSDNRKDFSFRLNPYIGQYFNGNRYGIRGNLQYRWRPYGTLAINYNINWFDMPHLDGVRNTVLIGPRLDLTFSKSVFLTTFVQYNSQSENTNINTRFQWRFAPVSDFFLVYTDNYFSGTYDNQDRFLFGIRNRAIVAKVTYWLNL